MRTSAGRRANNPTETTPGTWLIASSIASGSAMRRLCTSRIQLPLSVTTPSRHTGWPPVSRTSSRATRLRAIGTTSTGSGKRPSTSTRLDGSTMHTNFAEASAMIFSRVSAAPPPLIRRLRGSHSSAPSTYRPSGPVSLRSRTSMPCPRRRRVLCSELETAPAMRCRIRASASMKKATVEPVPTPTMLPSSTYSMAFSPARRLASDMSGLLEGKKQFPLRRRHRQHRQARTLADQRELLAERIGVGADLVQLLRPFLVAHGTHVDQVPARLFARGLRVEVLRLAIELGLVRVGCRHDLADAVDPRDLAVGV